MMCMRRLRGRYDFFIRGIKPAVTYIFHYSALEKPCILEYHSKRFPQAASVVIFDTMSVQPYFSGVNIIKSHQKLNHCCLARTGRSYYRDLLTRIHMRREIMNDNLVIIVSEFNMLEINLTVYVIRMYRIYRKPVFLLFFKKCENPLCRRRH